MAKKKPQGQRPSPTTAAPSSSGAAAAAAAAPNRPRNLLVLDATQPCTFAFSGRFAVHRSITVRQTPDDATWPGGALWDLGLLLAELLVALAAGGRPVPVAIGTAFRPDAPPRTLHRTVALPDRTLRSGPVRDWLRAMDDAAGAVVLELGAGVGLTGLVAAVAWDARLTLLTDLAVVVDRVTRPNIEANSVAAAAGRPRTVARGTGAVVALPLCWGDAGDERSVAEALRAWDTAPSGGVSRAQRRQTKAAARPSAANGRDSAPHTQQHQHRAQPPSRSVGMPTLVLIGDVAYQHRPGAPSHFEDLLSTLLKFTDHNTLVLFGTRMRMPASRDLLDMFREHFDELVEPPLVADELDPAFVGLKHNMTIHFLRRKRALSVA